ncbi:MAG TPA: hypothetical protein IGS52_00960 [Oscillatoriaceae cyanobacterium M33_DOE_052]|uniref:Tetratricopeptide repeat protein n=1 Tax=Planktothricoides sp. SpSt-374 TaxID=2282167 RepID=A0A7C3ZK70_9CYAN|nr:hypothetical protein [Oscillatoriaceae cyanobacterium M33_DOE_052]
MHHQGLGATFGLLYVGLTALSPLHLAVATTPPANLMVLREDVDGLHFPSIAQNPVSPHQEKGLEILSQALELAKTINDDSTDWPIPELALLYAEIGQPERAAEVLSLGMNGFIKEIKYAASTAGGLSSHEIIDYLAVLFAKVGESAPVFTLTDAITNNFDNNYRDGYVEETIRIVLEAMARAFFAEGKAEAALEIVAKIENQTAKGQALIGMADKSVPVALADKALEIVKSLNPGENGDVIVVKSQALAAIALSYARAGAAKKAAETFYLAYEIADLAYNDYSRITALQAIVIRYIQAEDFERSFEIVREINPGLLISPEILAYIAAQYAAAGQMELVFQIAEIVEKSAGSYQDERLRGIFAIVSTIARYGHPDLALEIANRIPVDSTKSYLKEDALAVVASSFATTGQYDQAIEIASKLEPGIYQNQAWEAIALSYMQAGKFEDGAKIAQRITNTLNEGDGILYKIALAAATGNNYNVTVKIVNQIDQKYGRQEQAFGDIAIQVAQKGNDDFAVKMAEKIPKNSSYRIQVFSQIAVSLAKAGETARANQIFRESLEAAENLENESQLSSAVGAIAGAYTEICQWEKAAQLGETIPEPEWKNKLFQQMAISYARAGNADAALVMADRVTGDTAIKYSVIWEIARQAAKAGDFDRAVALVPQVGDSSEQVALLVEIAAIAFTPTPPTPETQCLPLLH